MAIIKPNSIFRSISGSIGDSLILRRVGDTTILAAKPNKPRKRSRKPRSLLQQENSRRFGAAARFSKRMIKIPEVDDYFRKIAAGMGGTNNAYTALIASYRKTPGLTEEKVLELVRTTPPPPDENITAATGLAFSITGPNGDIIAQGVAVADGKGQWMYQGAFTGVKLVIGGNRGS